jgi:hypothetical protein
MTIIHRAGAMHIQTGEVIFSPSSRLHKFLFLVFYDGFDASFRVVN